MCEHTFKYDTLLMWRTEDNLGELILSTLWVSELQVR